jgi:hypothetical protein
MRCGPVTDYLGKLMEAGEKDTQRLTVCGLTYCANPTAQRSGEGGVYGALRGFREDALRHTNSARGRHSRESGYPVRRGFSALSLTALEYWVVRSSRTMTVVCMLTLSSKPLIHLGT